MSDSNVSGLSNKRNVNYWYDILKKEPQLNTSRSFSQGRDVEDHLAIEMEKPWESKGFKTDSLARNPCIFSFPSFPCYFILIDISVNLVGVVTGGCEFLSPEELIVPSIPPTRLGEPELLPCSMERKQSFTLLGLASQYPQSSHYLLAQFQLCINVPH